MTATRYLDDPPDGFPDTVFSTDSHRARYLRSNIFMNSPPPDYAVPHIGFETCPTFNTLHSSFLLYAADSSFYFATNARARAILGFADESAQKLNTAPFLWDQRNLTSASRLQYEEFQATRADSLGALHERILRDCSAFGRASSFTTSQLYQVLPRPSHQLASSVGNLLGDGGSAEPPSMRGMTRTSAPEGRKGGRLKKRKKSGQDQDQDQAQAPELIPPRRLSNDDE